MSPEVVEAVRAGDGERLEELLRADPRIVAGRDAAGRTPLHLAVDADDPSIAARLLAAGADLDAVSDEGRTPLHDAIECGRAAMLDWLLRQGATVDVSAAAILGRTRRLSGLLDADPALVNDRSTGLSPLGWAAYGNRTDSAQLLLGRGARMDDGELICAAQVGHVEVGRLLIDHGADPSEIDPRFGGNALHAAAAMKYTCDASAFVRLLLAHGVDRELRDRSGRTALEIARDGRDRARDAPAPDGIDRDHDAVIAALEDGA